MFWEWVSKHAKHIIFVIYGILFIYGLGLLVWGLADTTSQSSTVRIWITVGAVSALNSALGIYGTAVDDACLVYASITFMFLSCVAQILVIVVRISIPARPSSTEKAELVALFNRDDEEPFHEIEIRMQCCGITNFKDYEEKFEPFLLGFPPSCCGMTTSECLSPYKLGCHKAIMDARYREEALRATIFLGSSFLKFASAIVIAILTMWGDQLV